ncbi:hypothetical protein [Mucilaginibacter segetis]|uniref:Uncharacterized protein n=1 Tax=Mucilaginibacter segetis TaxID=2793071 RepID=A0A934PSP4_9SPHI|nr:hypothetical protein [Mucilaginibacter segetis]MBK0378253.1 hypothetical protein [Mucilaginibacter segetis]
MESIFNEADNKKLIDRINRLTPASRALWGKMNVSQMLAHSQMPVKIAFEEIQLKGGLMGLLFGKMAKKKLTRDDAPLEKICQPLKKPKLRTDKILNWKKKN